MQTPKQQWEHSHQKLLHPVYDTARALVAIGDLVMGNGFLRNAGNDGFPFVGEQDVTSLFRTLGLALEAQHQKLANHLDKMP